MLRRHVSSIAEEPEEPEKPKDKVKTSTLTALIEEPSSSPDDKPIPHRSSTKSSELTVFTENTLDKSGSEQLSADEEDDVFGELNESWHKKTTKTTKLEQEKHKDPTSSLSPSPDSAKNETELTEDQIREIKEAFLVFDDNGDGCISATELKKLVTSLGYNITEAELMDMMNQIDSDGNGAIDFPEFLNLMSQNLRNTDPEDIIMESFKVFDRDNNGSIGTQELQRVMKLLGQDFRDYEIEAMVKAADFDNDGKVGYEDFQRMMNI